MLTEVETAAAVLAFLYMKPEAEMVKGTKVFLREISENGRGTKATLAQLLDSVRVPLTYRLALEMGDEDPAVATKVRHQASNQLLLSRFNHLS